MGMIEAMIMEFEHEAANTRKVLERVPFDQPDFKPAEKSMTIQALASHLADVAKWAGPTCEMDVFELDPATWQPYKAESTEGLLKAFDENVAAAKKSMATVTDEKAMATWKMVMGGNTVIEMPRIQVLRGMILNHAVHHRAQLTVYLRMLGVALPSLYGPTADES